MALNCASSPVTAETAAATELEFADRGNNTLLTLEDSSRPARLLVAVRRGDEALPFAEVDRRQGRHVHLPTHILQPTPC